MVANKTTVSKIVRVSERGKGAYVDVQGVCVFVSELCSTGLSGTGGPGTPGQAASTTAQIYPWVAGFNSETAPS